MRTLELNKIELWIVNPASKVESVDSQGFLTGEFTTTYTTATMVRIMVYPSDGKIVEEIFGRDYSCDMVACSNDVVLSENTLVFMSQPSANYDTTFDYKVDKIMHSINTYQYGLKRRI